MVKIVVYARGWDDCLDAVLEVLGKRKDVEAGFG
jgi:hypothetical protein